MSRTSTYKMYDVSTAIFSENNIFVNTRGEMKAFSEMFFF